MSYYRLFDMQTHTYMATGYNAQSEKQLCEDYSSYKSVDWDEQETRDYYRKLDIQEVMELMRQDEFDIEISETPFEDDF